MTNDTSFSCEFLVRETWTKNLGRVSWALDKLVDKLAQNNYCKKIAVLTMMRRPVVNCLRYNVSDRTLLSCQTCQINFV